VPDAADDDEVNQITMKKEKQPKLPPTDQAKKPNEKVDFGLPEHGAFSDAHDGQRQDTCDYRKASISTQEDFAIPAVLQQPFSAGNTSSFEPTSSSENEPFASNFGNQLTATSSGKEQS
jgi:hypothetical protein